MQVLLIKTSTFLLFRKRLMQSFMYTFCLILLKRGGHLIEGKDKYWNIFFNRNKHSKYLTKLLRSSYLYCQDI